MPEYQPISCMQHERLEFSVLRKIPLLLEYRDGAEKIRHDAIISFVEAGRS